jgi:hypothetical protein
MQQEVAVVDRHLEFNGQHVLPIMALSVAVVAVVEVPVDTQQAAKEAIITAAGVGVVAKVTTVVVVGAVAVGTFPVTAVVPVLLGEVAVAVEIQITAA